MNNETQPSSSPEQEVESLPLKKPRRRRRSRNRLKHWYARVRHLIHIRLALLFLSCFFIIGVVVINAGIEDSIASLDASWHRLNRVLSEIQNRHQIEPIFKDFTRLRVSIADLNQHLQSTHRRISMVKPLIQMNEEWQASYKLLEAANLIVSSAQEIVIGIEPVVNFLKEPEDYTDVISQISSSEQVVDMIKFNQSHFHQATNSLEIAKSKLDEIDLSSSSTTLIINHKTLLTYQQQLTAISSLLIESPDILTQLFGISNDVTFLILAQNNDEIRPSGGYISAYGWLTIRNGRVSDFSFSPTTSTSPQPPPASFANNYDIPTWWLDFQNPIYGAWDKNWYVDFPTSAMLALEYYNQGNNPKSPVSGVIAVDLSALQEIIAVLGDVSVPNYDQDLNYTNFRTGVYATGAFEGQDHNAYIANIYEAMFQNWQLIDARKTESMLTILLQELNDNHISVFMSDSASQNAIDSLGWSGAQSLPDTNDYILVADANFVNKSNRSITRSLTYNVEIRPDFSRLSNLNMRYDYFNSLAQNDPAINEEHFGPRDYQTLTQIYLPKDITVLNSDNLNQMTTTMWNNYTLLISQLNVDYDTSEQFQLTYESPPIEEKVDHLHRYRLLLQKQSGSNIQDVNLEVKLPPNATFIDASPPANVSYSQDQTVLNFRLQVVSDQWVEVLYSLGS